MKVALLLGIISMVVVVGLSAQPALAHRSGCHNLHSCPSDSDTYVCGDLGYPCDGSRSINDVALEDIVVPLLVEATFEKIFERVPSEAESTYWKKRFRSDKGSLTKIRRAMRWHKGVGSFGPSVAPAGAMDGKPSVLIPKINTLFRSVYDGRNPTGSENRYWLSRIGDKPTEQVLLDAMTYHRVNDIQH